MHTSGTTRLRESGDYHTTAVNLKGQQLDFCTGQADPTEDQARQISVYNESSSQFSLAPATQTPCNNYSSLKAKVDFFKMTGRSNPTSLANHRVSMYQKIHKLQQDLAKPFVKESNNTQGTTTVPSSYQTEQ